MEQVARAPPPIAAAPKPSQTISDGMQIYQFVSIYVKYIYVSNDTDTDACTMLPIRVAKCHRYDGYIRVKILAGWGKSLGEHAIWQNQAVF